MPGGLILMNDEKIREEQIRAKIWSMKKRKSLLNEIDTNTVEFQKVYSELDRRFDMKIKAKEANYDHPFINDMVNRSLVECDRLYNHILFLRSELIKHDEGCE